MKGPCNYFLLLCLTFNCILQFFCPWIVPLPCDNAVKERIRHPVIELMMLMFIWSCKFRYSFYSIFYHILVYKHSLLFTIITKNQNILLMLTAVIWQLSCDQLTSQFLNNLLICTIQYRTVMHGTVTYCHLVKVGTRK